MRPLPHKLFAAFLICHLPLIAKGQFEQPEQAGVAFVTSLEGQVRFTNAEGSDFKPKLHSEIQIDAYQLEVPQKGFCAFVCSNGVALTFDQGTRAEIVEFKQIPISAKKESQLFEPSVSKLSIRVEEGTIAIASNHLSPLSAFRVELPYGDIRILSTYCVISVNEDAIQITTYDGNLTFTSPEGGQRQFLSNRESMRIDRNNGSTNKNIQLVPMTEVPAAFERLIEAATYARTRVFFKSYSTNPSLPAKAILLAPPGYYEQEPVRPFHYLD